MTGGEQRTRILEALARGDGQMLDGFDLGHTAEMMYGKQADAVALLIGQETHRFAMELAEDFAHDARLTKGLPGDRHTRRALAMAADELRRRATTRHGIAQADYNQTSLAKPLTGSRPAGGACGLGRCLFTYTAADEQDYSDLYAADEDAS